MVWIKLTHVKSSNKRPVLSCVINRSSLCFNFITHQSNQNNDHKTGQVGLEKCAVSLKPFVTIEILLDTVIVLSPELRLLNAML